MTLSRLPSFTPEARKFWDAIAPSDRRFLLDNVYCGTCRGAVTIADFDGKMVGNSLLLHGRCNRCGGEVARLLEGV